MKTLLTSLSTFAVFGTAAYASGLSDPIVEPELIAAEVEKQYYGFKIFASLAILALILGTAGAF